MQTDQLKCNYSNTGKECGNSAKESSSENEVNVPDLKDIQGLSIRNKGKESYSCWKEWC